LARCRAGRRDVLKAAGAEAVFPVGTVIAEAAGALLTTTGVSARAGTSRYID
jgi:methylmalonyl-CoA mutase cobalamin-binding subunit